MGITGRRWHTHPCCVVLEIAGLVLDGVFVVELAEEAQLLQNLLPLLGALLARVRHLLNGDHLRGRGTRQGPPVRRAAGGDEGRY